MENKDSLVTSIIINNNDTIKDNTIQYTFLNTNGSFELNIKPEEVDTIKKQCEHIENLEKIISDLKESLRLTNIETDVYKQYKEKYNKLLEESTKKTKIDDNKNTNENDYISVKKEMISLEETVRILSNENDILKKEITNRDKLLSSEQEKLNILKKKISYFDNLFKEVNSKADEYLGKIGKLKEDNSNLGKERQEIVNKYEKLKEENNNLTKVNQELSKKLDDDIKTYNKIITDLNKKKWLFN